MGGAVGLALGILVDRMRGHAIFGNLVHLARTDLQLDTLARRTDDGGVDRTIVVLLGGRDVILEPAGNHRPAGVDQAQSAVTVLDRVDDHAETKNVGQLFEGQRLGFHLAEHRPGLLLPAFDASLDVVFLEQGRKRVLDLGEHTLVALRYLRQPGGHRAVGFGIDEAEGDLLQLLAHALHAHAPGQRRIDFHRLLGDAHALVLAHMVEGTHVVEPVGELDQENANVLRNRQQQLAQILGLLGLLGNKVQLLELGQPFHQLAHVRTEQFVDLGAGRGGILDRVVQQGDRDGRLVEMHVGEDGSNFERVRKIGIAGSTLLVAMLLHGINIGLVEQRLVDVGLVALHALDKLILTHHGRILAKLK